MKVQLKQNGQVIQQFYTFNSGGYSFKTDSLSTYTVDIDTTALPITVVCPASGSRTVSLSTVDSVETYEGFGMQCSGIDFGVIDIWGYRFRPTFTTGVSINAGNISLIKYNADCGAGTSGTVTTTFTGSAHYVSPAAGALTPSSVSGNTLTYNLSNLDTLITGSLDIILSTDTGAVAGTYVCINTTVTPLVPDANLADNTLTQCFPILHSWDPNLKEVYPSDTIHNGDWLTYTIHFQNTGNDTAYTVIVQDTLSPDVDASSFQYLASSHHAVIQLFGNAMVFTFPKINLVDSATNPSLSEGWIQYKVKSNLGLTNNTAINNTAYIYFDQNPAVVTNTTTNHLINCSDTTVILSQSICANDSFLFYNSTLKQAGTYYDTLHSVGGCDSILVLNLTILSITHDTISQIICSNDSFVFAGQTYHNAGAYSHTYTGTNTCDSTVTLLLTVAATVYDTISQTICSTDSFVFSGQTYHNPGTYSHTYSGVNTCDSTVTLLLSVAPTIYDTVSQNICSTDSFLFGGNTYHTAGTYSHTFTGANTCDSSVTLLLSINPLIYDTITRNICANDTVLYWGIEWGVAGYFPHYGDVGSNGCDSITVVHIITRPISYDTITRTICSGDSVVIGTQAYHSQGHFTHTVTGSNGCDSIVTLDLNVKPSPVVSLNWQTLLQARDLVLWPDTVWALYCNPNVFPMAGGLPIGGTYTGRLIQNDTFNFGYSYLFFTDTISYSYMDTNGCSSVAVDTLIISMCEGISDINTIDRILLYPNPNNGTFTLQTTNSLHSDYIITNMLGETIEQKAITSDTQTIDLSDAASGVYTLVVQGTVTSRPLRFVIVR